MTDQWIDLPQDDPMRNLLADLSANLEMAPGPEATAVLLQRIKTYQRCIRSLRADADLVMIDHIRDMGPVEIGSTIYKVGRNKSVRPKLTPVQTFDRMMFESGGDLIPVVACLQANAFKQASTRSVLGDAWDEVWEVKWNDELKLKEGNPEYDTSKATANDVARD